MEEINCSRDWETDRQRLMRKVGKLAFKCLEALGRSVPNGLLSLPSLPSEKEPIDMHKAAAMPWHKDIKVGLSQFIGTDAETSLNPAGQLKEQGPPITHSDERDLTTLACPSFTPADLTMAFNFFPPSRNE